MKRRAGDQSPNRKRAGPDAESRKVRKRKAEAGQAARAPRPTNTRQRSARSKRERKLKSWELQSEVANKVLNIFRELVGERAVRLDGARPASEAMAKVGRAFHRRRYARDVVSDIAHHVADWNAEAAFVVALHLFPERFTAAEVHAGTLNLVIHAPNHLAAAAKLTGYPISDVFGLGHLLAEEE